MYPNPFLFASTPQKKSNPFKTACNFFSSIKARIQIRREPPPPPNTYLAQGGRVWARTHLYLGMEHGWTRAELAVFHEINRAIQIRKRRGKLTVPELRRFTGLSERGIYKALRKLKDRGVIYALTAPGRGSIYYLTEPYAAPRVPPPLNAGTPHLRTKEKETTPLAPASDAPYQKSGFTRPPRREAGKGFL